MNNMLHYTIARNANANDFKKACDLIEANVNGIIKEKLLIDVDGTAIQLYRKDGKQIKVIDDYEVDAVYVDSEIDLKNIM